MNVVNDLSTLTISVSVFLYSTLSSFLILAVCRTCVTYEPSRWLIILTISVSIIIQYSFIIADPTSM